MTLEAALRVLAQAPVNAFAAAHGRIAGAELVVLGLGRLGGGVLTHASDLDLVFLFTGDFAAESDGPRPLGATLYFNRLAQRVGAALSVPTAEGALYEVDTRLRPQGTQGPLAASLSSFSRYQREEAWVWEHMALARARVVFGSAAAGAAVAGVMDVHAAAIAIAAQVADGRISANQAVVPTLVACTTSTAAKILFATTAGTRPFGMRVIPGLVLIVGAAWAGGWFVSALG